MLSLYRLEYSIQAVVVSRFAVAARDDVVECVVVCRFPGAAGDVVVECVVVCRFAVAARDVESVRVVAGKGSMCPSMYCHETPV